MYDKANVCRIANQLVKEGCTRSDAFVAAWKIEKNRVANIAVQSPAEIEEAANNTVELAEKVREYKEIQRAIEEMEAKLEAVKDIIINGMDGAEEIEVDIFKVRYKTVASNRFDTTTFKKTNNELYSQYLKESVCKRFTVAV